MFNLPFLLPPVSKEMSLPALPLENMEKGDAEFMNLFNESALEEGAGDLSQNYYEALELVQPDLQDDPEKLEAEAFSKAEKALVGHTFKDTESNEHPLNSEKEADSPEVKHVSATEDQGVEVERDVTERLDARPISAVGKDRYQPLVPDQYVSKQTIDQAVPSDLPRPRTMKNSFVSESEGREPEKPSYAPEKGVSSDVEKLIRSHPERIERGGQPPSAGILSEYKSQSGDSDAKEVESIQPFKTRTIVLQSEDEGYVQKSDLAASNSDKQVFIPQDHKRSERPEPRQMSPINLLSKVEKRDSPLLSELNRDISHVTERLVQPDIYVPRHLPTVSRNPEQTVTLPPETQASGRLVQDSADVRHAPLAAISDPMPKDVQNLEGMKTESTSKTPLTRHEREPLPSQQAVVGSAAQPVPTKPLSGQGSVSINAGQSMQAENAAALGMKDIDVSVRFETLPDSEGFLTPLTESRGTSGHMTRLEVVMSHRSEMAANIARQFVEVVQKGGSGSVEIALRPEELGKVRMVIGGADGAISMNILAERSETLELMRRHVEQLTQEFLAIGYSDINFSFDQQSGDGAETGEQPSDSEMADPLQPLASQDTHHATLSVDGGIDIRF